MASNQDKASYQAGEAKAHTEVTIDDLDPSILSMASSVRVLS
jgi:hypothetical protein